MKVVALRTVYNRSESKEYVKGQTFETSEREARVMLKLRKVEAAEKTAKRAAPRQDAVLTAAMKADAPAPDRATPADDSRRYRRRDLQAQD